MLYMTERAHLDDQKILSFYTFIGGLGGIGLSKGSTWSSCHGIITWYCITSCKVSKSILTGLGPIN